MKISTKNISFCKNDISFTNYIELWYKIDSSDELIAKRALLPRLLLSTSKKYSNASDMDRAKTLHYILNNQSGTGIVGNCKFFKFSFEIPQKRKIKDVDLLKSLEFMLDIIYHPNVKDDEFVEYDDKLKILKSNMEHIAKDKVDATIEKLNALLDEDGSLTNYLYHHQDQLEQLTSKEEYEFYKTVVNQKPFIFLFGNEELKESEAFFQKYFAKYSDIEVDVERENHYLTLHNQVQEIEETKPYHESLLFLIYKVENMKEEDEKYLMLIKDLLTYKSTNLLHKKLRTEKKLVYHASCILEVKHGSLAIVGGIHRDNKEEMMDAVNELFESFCDEDKIKELLPNLHEEYECNLIRNLDSKSYMRNEFLDKYFNIAKTDKEIIEELKTITALELKEFMKRLKLDYIYFLRGEEDAR